MTDELQELWQSEEPEASEVNVQPIRDRASKLDRSVRNRNLLEAAVGGGLVLAWAGLAFVFTHPIALLGLGLLELGTLWIVYVTVVHARKDLPGPDTPTETWLAHWRAYLDHQIQLLRRAWLWYVSPITLGCCVFLLGVAIETDQVWALPIYFGGFLVVGGSVAWMNVRASRALQKERDALEAAWPTL